VVSNSVPLATINYLYDGWNLIAEVAPGGSLIRNYVWGTDLSGSAQGAGGVGGLLEVTYHGTAATNAFVAYDGNGNVASLVNAADGTLLANYEYGPFGEVIRATGPMAKLNPFRFSTKYQDDETDFLYYGYRYYNPSTGRWLSRDLIGENGGLNLYCFIGNDSIGKADYLGLEQIQIWASAYIPSVWFIFPYPAALDPAAIWLGDGRRGPVVGGSARAYHLLTIETDPTKNPVVSNTSGGGVTTVIYHTSGGGEGVATAADTAPPLATVTRTASGCTTIVEMSADTHDPLVSFAPSLHYDYTMRFDVNAGRVTIVGSHGRFPAFDLIIGGKTYVNYIPTGVNDWPGALKYPRMDVVAIGSIQKYNCCSP